MKSVPVCAALLVFNLICVQVGLAQWTGESTGQCERLPSDATSLRTPGDNGFHIAISGNPEKYVPGEKYAVMLKGWKTQVSVQKFLAFMLVVEPSTSEKEINPNTVGTFQLFGDTFTKFSSDCPNAVVHTSMVYKSEIQVLWIAPPAGAGCVQFKALLVEQKDIWYMDEGGLTKQFCEEEQENLDQQPEVLEECCACDEAKYEVVFEGLWTRHTHPKDFPTNEWLTHFSDIIGASHSPDYTMWEYGGVASEGLQYVAEWGATRNMETELKAQSSHIRTIIKARGLWYPNVNGKTFAVFRVDRRHHLMSLVSMLGPSPDWVVGVSKLELCLQNCSWATHKVLNLYPWDAGTDSGVSYESPNTPTHPREKIRQITTSYPNNPEAPFYDPTGKTPMKPVAQLIVTRQRLYEKACSDHDFFPVVDGTDNIETSEDSRPECAVSEWGSFTPCSVTCAKGLRTRRRTYLMPMKADMMGCTEQLEQNEMCAARIPVCPDGSDEDSPEVGFALVPQRCAVSPWSPWSECSVTCGKGTMYRTRRYLDPSVQKMCTLNTRETTFCMSSIECENGFQDDGICMVTAWSDWSPCTVTCGKGTRFRVREYLKQGAEKMCDISLMDEEMCMGDKLDCSVSMAEAKEICMQESHVGPCRGYFPRWYFDLGKAMCLQFIYGGCRGNKNNFERYEECNEMCAFLRGPHHAPTQDEGNSVIYERRLPEMQKPDMHKPPQFEMHKPPQPVARPINCMLSEWTAWSPCSVTCGRGRMEKRRMIKVEPQNGGKSCPRKRIQRKRCNKPACH
uniref:Spondin-1 n=1 Tax=Strigamia maritima TaxID=126957 RepID=T1JBH1_STRMM